MQELNLKSQIEGIFERNFQECQQILQLGGIQYLRKQVEVGGWLVNCLRL